MCVKSSGSLATSVGPASSNDPPLEEGPARLHADALPNVLD